MKNKNRMTQNIWYKIFEILSQNSSLNNKQIYKNKVKRNKKYVYGKNTINVSKW